MIPQVAAKKGKAHFVLVFGKNGKKTLSQICADVRGLRELSEELRTSPGGKRKVPLQFPSSFYGCPLRYDKKRSRNLRSGILEKDGFYVFRLLKGIRQRAPQKLLGGLKECYTFRYPPRNEHGLCGLRKRNVFEYASFTLLCSTRNPSLWFFGYRLQPKNLHLRGQ